MLTFRMLLLIVLSGFLTACDTPSSLSQDVTESNQSGELINAHSSTKDHSKSKLSSVSSNGVGTENAGPRGSLITSSLDFWSDIDSEQQRLMCRNLEQHEFCRKFDEGVDSTYGLKPIDLSEWVKNVYGRTYENVLSAGEARQLIKTKKHYDLNEYFGSIQQSFEEGKIGEFEYNRLFDEVMSFLDDVPIDSINEWVAYDQNSVFALAARGRYYFQRGWSARGTKFYNETPSKNIDAMKTYMELSRTDLEAAIKGSPKFIYAHQALISTSHMAGDADKKTLQYLQNTLDVMPSAYYPRKRYLSFLVPKWGGSHLEMRKFAESAQKYSAEQPMLRYLLALEYKGRGNILQADGKLDEAVKAYDKAMHHGVDSEMLKTTYWVKYSLKKYKRAEYDANLLVSMYPDDPSQLKRRGQVRYAQKKYSLGFADYKKAASIAPGFSDGWEGMGYYYFWIERNFSLAEKYYAKAVDANAKNSEAQYRLAWSLIERHKAEGLDEMRSYVELCKQVKCRDADLSWAAEWVNCIDEVGECSMDRADYAHWRFAGETQLH